MNYKEYLLQGNKEERAIIDRLNEAGQLIKENLDGIEKVKKNTKVIVYAEPRCKDAATQIPFLLKLSELNKNINIEFKRRINNEEELLNLSGEGKVPTFLIIDEKGRVIRKYIEFPYKVKEKLIKAKDEEVTKIIEDMREGKYNLEIQEDLISFLNGEKYKFISFSKKSS